ncbi:xanthomonadin biosynthesis 3-hydroxybenozate--AMP ligase XanA2 [soil metagenome]
MSAHGSSLTSGREREQIRRPPVALSNRDADAPIAIRDDEVVTCGQLWFAARQWAERLPDRAFAINLCADRYHFLIAFLAVILRGQCNLLPPTRQPVTLRELLHEFPDAYLLHDGMPVLDGCVGLDVSQLTVSSGGITSDIPSVPAEQTAALVFTSGSTGQPRAVRKSWHNLREAALLNRSYLFRDGLSSCGMVSTAPPGHMYGLEWSIMLPLFSDCTVWCGEAFFPDDIRGALARLDGRRVLVSTPLHLRSIVRSGLQFPDLHTVLCATAPLDCRLARDVEARLSTRLLEIYGCSEAGSLACRWPVRDPAWRLFREFRIESAAPRVRVSADHLPEPIELADTIRFQADGSFTLEGRDADLIKVGGKRASLSEINLRLLRLDGVEDGVVYHPPDLGLDDTGRLAALVVSDSQSAEAIRRQLARVLDRAFVPRPVRLVARLPRTAAGKMRREDLLQLIGECPPAS